jgi:uncharacterized membrane protein YphA (DoxX/SURF4 family)
MCGCFGLASRPVGVVEMQRACVEFLAYGLPVWFMWVVGTLKVSLAILLIVGLWKNYLTQPAAIGIAVLMLGAIAMHFKVGDPSRSRCRRSLYFC